MQARPRPGPRSAEPVGAALGLDLQQVDEAADLVLDALEPGEGVELSQGACEALWRASGRLTARIGTVKTAMASRVARRT
ncbi:hypothetical protein [Palleronia aestuarii]|uniref:hypothetical protein n=1 Tax=Palleronia aestuarii TaxID=568105 RepID=UPI001F1E9029|nr:hypothetical protein [Palleronia aestuarii]